MSDREAIMPSTAYGLSPSTARMVPRTCGPGLDRYDSSTRRATWRITFNLLKNGMLITIASTLRLSSGAPGVSNDGICIISDKRQLLFGSLASCINLAVVGVTGYPLRFEFGGGKPRGGGGRMRVDEEDVAGETGCRPGE